MTENIIFILKEYFVINLNHFGLVLGIKKWFFLSSTYITDSSEILEILEFGDWGSDYERVGLWLWTFSWSAFKLPVTKFNEIET